MTNKNFRRELGHVFDEMTGSPSAALPDRVRSSLANVPEQKAPFWIAGVAAAVIAAMVVGIVVVGNFNRPQTKVLPVGVPTSSLSPAPEPSPPNSIQGYGCGSSSIVENSPAPAPAFVSAIRTGTHAGYDRVTIEFTNGPPIRVDARAQIGSTFTQGPSGREITLAGHAGVLVTIHGADEHTNYSGPTDFKTNYPALKEARQVQDFEGTVQWALGTTTACYRVFMLTNPDRLVIDIQA
jgi:hypothetical protein